MDRFLKLYIKTLDHGKLSKKRWHNFTYELFSILKLLLKYTAEKRKQLLSLSFWFFKARLESFPSFPLGLQIQSVLPFKAH